MEHFDVKPPPIEVIFVARENSKIVGTLGFDYCNGDGEMPLEEIFAFDKNKTPLTYDPRRSIQFSRWTAENPKISIVLIYASTLYALNRGMCYGWSEQKEKAAKSAIRAGVQLHEVCDAVIRTNSIPREIRRFYTTKPAPKLYMVELGQMLRAASKRTSLLISSGVLHLEKSA